MLIKVYNSLNSAKNCAETHIACKKESIHILPRDFLAKHTFFVGLKMFKIETYEIDSFEWNGVFLVL